MVLKVYGYGWSACTRTVLLVCKEKQIPYEFITVDLKKGENRHPPYVKHQPFGQVPYIDDDGFILFESRAIARYLIEKYPNQGTPGLIPTEPKAKALFEQAASIEVANFDRVAAEIAFETVVKQHFGLNWPTNQGQLKDWISQLAEKLDAYDVMLGKHKYLAGDEVTLADLTHLPHATLVAAGGNANLFESRSNVARWFKDISSRPAWLEVVNST
ncbi:thioredoxin-like protein [Phlebopus sp. FC_14]|nr:thioredoxin-like protein [Phlebopus sp. FC_14]